MTTFMKRIAPLFALALLALGTANDAQAAATVAGTQVDNQAFMTYDVATVTQSTVYSDGNGPVGLGGKKVTRFLVDRKINLTVAKTDGAIVEVAPGKTNAVLTFTVKNEGNAPQDFALSSIAQGAITDAVLFGGITDNFDATIVGIFVESQAVPDGYTAGTDMATNIINLAPDGIKTVYIVVDIPNTRLDKDIAIYSLVATAKEPNTAAATAVTETAGGDTVLTMDTVFADSQGSDDAAGHDAAHSARSAFKVKAPVLSMNKSSAVIWDPINLSNGTQKAIPGAIIEYTITITNSVTATGTATNVAISDSLAAMVGAGNISYNAGTLTLDGVVQTDAVDSPATDYGSVVGNVVSVSNITLAPTATVVIKYRVTITAA